MTTTEHQSPPPTPQPSPIVASYHSLRPAIVGQFLAVILIWSLTPLAAVWTVKEIHWAWGLFLRFSLALPFALLLLVCFKLKMPFSKQACLSYFAGAIGLFGSMTLCYIGAQYVPSAVISMIYGFAPLVSGLICVYLLKYPKFSRTQVIGLSIATLGMGFALGIGSSGSAFNIFGVALQFLAVLLYVVSALAVTKLGKQIHPITQMVGATLFSWIGYLVILPFFPDLPNWHDISLNAYMAIIYSALFSSVLAMICYYSLIHHVKTTTLMLTTIMTPVIATLWGYWFNQEDLGHYYFIGLGLVCFGLILYSIGKNSLDKNT